MKIPKSQGKKYKLIGTEVNFIDKFGALLSGKIGGFTSDKVIIATWNLVEGEEIEQEKVIIDEDTEEPEQKMEPDREVGELHRGWRF